jgi:subtilase family serine protease
MFNRVMVGAAGALLCTGSGGLSAAQASPSIAARHSNHLVCGSVRAGDARCHAHIVDLAKGGPKSGYTPKQLQTVYALPSSTNGSGQTVAIVDAFDDPKAESDLAKYRSTFGLGACTTASGCFRKVNQTGGTTYPRANAGWASEISLDLDMASAICPKCHILLVEAKTNSLANLAAAVDTAAALGATQISNSYGGKEGSGELAADNHYNHPGIAITASSGDSGFGVSYPAASRFVTAVGGTTLTLTSSNSRSAEIVWNGAGSGCSAFESKPAWQADTGCTKRTVADVSADADPNTGVSVYDTFHASGWQVFGGTSVSSPIIASVYALAGNAGSTTYGSFSYAHTASLFDVTTGTNGTPPACPRGSYLCNGEPRYDGPTGNGTPNGIGGF